MLCLVNALSKKIPRSFRNEGKRNKRIGWELRRRNRSDLKSSLGQILGVNSRGITFPVHSVCPRQIQGHLWMFPLTPDPVPELFSHLPSSSSPAGQSIPRISGAFPGFQEHSPQSLIPGHSCVSIVPEPVAQIGLQPPGKGGSVTSRAQIPLQDKGRRVFWEVTSMFHLWHPKKRLRAPFGSPLYLLKPGRASTPRKFGIFTLKTFLWNFPHSLLLLFPLHFDVLFLFFFSIILKLPFPHPMSNCDKSWNCGSYCDLKGIPGFKSQQKIMARCKFLRSSLQSDPSLWIRLEF